MIKKVLIATDGSDHARNAVAFGSDIAAKYDADLLIVHVLLRNELPENLRRMAEVDYLTTEGSGPLLQVITSAPADLEAPSENVVTTGRLLRIVGEQLLDRAERVAHEHGVRKVDKRIEDGDPVSEILKIIEEEGVDLVVSGARGLSDLKALMIGSISHKLSHLSPVTCVTVR